MIDATLARAKGASGCAGSSKARSNGSPGRVDSQPPGQATQLAATSVTAGLAQQVGDRFTDEHRECPDGLPDHDVRSSDEPLFGVDPAG